MSTAQGKASISVQVSVDLYNLLHDMAYDRKQKLSELVRAALESLAKGKAVCAEHQEVKP